jgi:AcrR family transcriptional regulator
MIFQSLRSRTVSRTIKREKDRRIQKTRKSLHLALFALIHERDFDSIAVKEILHRANVGRSTFYSHFRDKEQLLISGIQDMLRSARPAAPSLAKPYTQIIWFSLPIFEHVDQLRRTGQTQISTRGRAILHDRLQQILADLIAEDVRRILERRPKSAAQIPPEIVVQHVASTFIQVLNWWLESGSPLRSKEVNGLFHSLILPTLSAIFEDQRPPK